MAMSMKKTAADAVRRRMARIVREPRFAFLAAAREALPESEWYVVGGAVRDAIRGETPADIDFVVRHARVDALAPILERFGSVNVVGATFGVIKLTPAAGGGAIDIAWPRTEHAGMSGAYRDVIVRADPSLPIAHDLARRDFTVNAVAWNVATGELVDPSGGVRDIRGGIIRAVGDPRKRFREDYSRLLRALRFACRLGYAIEKHTWDALVELMPKLLREREVDTPHGKKRAPVVPFETIAKEFVKALSADAPQAIDLFEASGALFMMIPELIPLASCTQSPDVHAEGDVWTHTKLAIAALSSKSFSRRFPGERADVETVIAVLLHDVAKPLTAWRKGERRTFYGHDVQGAAIAERVVSRLRLASVAGHDIDAARVAWLVQHHLFPNLVDLRTVKKTTLAKYFLDDGERGRRLLHLAFADASASLRPNGKTDLRRIGALLKILASFKKTAARQGSVASGKDVMAELDLPPGPEVGRVLEALKEAQLNGRVRTHEEAVRFLRALHGKLS